MKMDSKWTGSKRNEFFSPQKDQAYDILIVERNNDLSDYETSASVASNRINRGFNRSQKVEMIKGDKQKKFKNLINSRYKPFTLGDYSRKRSNENLFSKAGGFGHSKGTLIFSFTISYNLCIQLCFIS